MMAMRPMLQVVRTPPPSPQSPPQAASTSTCTSHKVTLLRWPTLATQCMLVMNESLFRTLYSEHC